MDEMRRIKTVAFIAAVALVMTAADAQSARKRERAPAEAPPPPAAPPDKRDRLVAAPGTPFSGRPYWQALAQCGGVYFQAKSLHSSAALPAQGGKPRPAGHAPI